VLLVCACVWAYRVHFNTIDEKYLLSSSRQILGKIQFWGAISMLAL